MTDPRTGVGENGPGRGAGNSPERQELERGRNTSTNVSDRRSTAESPFAVGLGRGRTGRREGSGPSRSSAGCIGRGWVLRLEVHAGERGLGQE